MLNASAPVRIDISGGFSDVNPYRREYGSAVLNVAINLMARGTLDRERLELSLGDIPPQSGLGSSGAINTVYLALCNPCLIKHKKKLIERVNILEERCIGNTAGLQDQAASIYGGMNYWEFRSDGSLFRRKISRKRSDHFFNRLVLVYVDKRDRSSVIMNSIFSRKNYAGNKSLLSRIKDLAREMADSIDDEEAMTSYINKTWELSRQLHQDMETPLMRRLQESLQGEYLGTRVLGAGGGGCMYFYTQDKARLSKKILGLELDHSIKIIPFEFDYEGISVEEVSS